MARMVATKAALSIRLDALSDDTTKSDVDSASIGLEARIKLESRLRMLEQGLGIRSLKGMAKSAGGNSNGTPLKSNGNGARYNDAADSLIPTAAKVVVEEKEERKEKKDKKKKKKDEEAVEVEATEVCSFSLFCDERERVDC